MAQNVENQGTDEALFASLPGGHAVIEWFGFCPRFHDATLDGLRLSRGEASLAIKVFRMTDQIDDRGYFVLDRHALVTLRISDVTGLKLDGDTTSIILELTVRRLAKTPDRSEWLSCNGPVHGDIEVAFVTSVGLDGVIYGKNLQFEIQPLARLETT